MRKGLRLRIHICIVVREQKKSSVLCNHLGGRRAGVCLVLFLDWRRKMIRKPWQYALCGHIEIGRAPRLWPWSVDLEHISRQAHNSVEFQKNCFSHKMASATKRFRNAVSFKLNRFMPLSQTIYRKQCLSHFELRGCIVSKKKEKSPHMLEICWQ